MARPIDPKELADQLNADKDILESPRRDGDIASIVRPVDVLFVGDPERFAPLHDELERRGWRVKSMHLRDPETAEVGAERDQTTDASAIRDRTEASVALAAKFEVTFDGWGCVIQIAQ